MEGHAMTLTVNKAKRYTMNMDAEIHKQLKLYCTHTEKKMQDVVNELIKAFLKTASHS